MCARLVFGWVYHIQCVLMLLNLSLQKCVRTWCFFFFGLRLVFTPSILLPRFVSVGRGRGCGCGFGFGLPLAAAVCLILVLFSRQVDCVEERELCATQNLMAFPTIRFFKVGKK